MIGWAFAVSMLLAVLAFELVVFRYLSAGGPAVESSGTGDGTRSGVTSGRRGPAGRECLDAAGAVRPCPDCGAANDDSPTVRYCRNCLAQL